MPELTEKDVLLIMTVFQLMDKWISPAQVKIVFDQQKEKIKEAKKDPEFQAFWV
jgi:hypothetical protein